MKGYTRVKYPTQRFYIEEGCYTLEEIEAIFVDCIKINEERQKMLGNSMKETQSDEHI